MIVSYEKTRDEAEKALAAGDARAAFNGFRFALSRADELDLRQFAEALRLFARIAAAAAGEDWAAHVRPAAANPSDPQALYNLGYQLIEQSVYDVAAGVLARANREAPGVGPIVTELVVALEHEQQNARALEVLRGAPAPLRDNPLCQYLLAFNALMTTDLATPRDVLRRVEPLADETLRPMIASLREMLQRADAVRGVAPLTDRDLRGWHFVVTGALLLHLSPFGCDEGMNGRYAYTQDSADRCLEGLRRAEAALAALDTRPPRVLLLPDRESAALGVAAAGLLQLPAERWDAGAADRAGLIVAYDLERLPPEVLAWLAEHRPGQVLFSQAAQWTYGLPFTADLTTYLYQVNFSPWQEGRLQMDAATQKPLRAPEVPGTPEQLAAEISSASLEADALNDLPTLTALASAVARAPASAGPGATRSAGRRRRHRNDSPVKSSRFL